MGMRGRTTVKWDNSVGDLRKERKKFEWARMMHMNRNKWRLFCHGHPLKEIQETDTTLDRQTYHLYDTQTKEFIKEGCLQLLATLVIRMHFSLAKIQLSCTLSTSFICHSCHPHIDQSTTNHTIPEHTRGTSLLSLSLPHFSKYIKVSHIMHYKMMMRINYQFYFKALQPLRSYSTKKVVNI